MCPKSEKDLFGNNQITSHDKTSKNTHLGLKIANNRVLGIGSSTNSVGKEDIWNVLLSSNQAPTISNVYFKTQPRGALNKINSMIRQDVDEKIQQFVSQYDLDHLFALDMELNWLIRKFASFIFDETIYLSGEIINNIIPTLHNRFDNINEIIDFKLLLSEIYDAKSVFHQSGQKGIVVNKNMTMLAMLQKATETNIENNPLYSPIEKAERYLNSYLISNEKYCHNESLVYLLCKQRKNQIVIQETISRIERYDVRTRDLSLVDIDPFISIPQSNALRLADWKYIRYVNDLSSDKLSFIFEPFFSRPFSLYRADLGIMYRWEELSDTIETLQSIFERLSTSSDALLSHTGRRVDKIRLTSAIASVLVFVYYRLNGKFGKKSIINRAIHYLLSNQEYDKSIAITAMTVHAIAMAKLPDSQKFLTKAKDWLLEKQTKYGYWYQPGENPDYTTVLVLDAIELAEGGDKLTFTPNFKLDESKKDQSDMVNKTDDLSIDEKTHTIIYKGKKIHISGGGNNWDLFCLLYSKRGNIATHEEIEKATEHHETNKIKHELVRALKKKGAKELADKIKNAHSMGFYLEV